MAELTKEDRIKREKNKLFKTYKRLPEDKLLLARPLIENAAFMKVTLEDLAADINENGSTEEYQNGPNQSGTKLTSATQAYNTMIKNYNTVNARLEAMLPPPKTEGKLDAFTKL